MEVTIGINEFLFVLRAYDKAKKMECAINRLSSMTRASLSGGCAVAARTEVFSAAQLTKGKTLRYHAKEVNSQARLKVIFALKFL